MNSDQTEKQVKNFYDSEGWISDDQGRVTEDALFRELKGSRGDYGKKVELQPSKLLDGRTGTLLCIGSGDLPRSHLKAAESFQKIICVDISKRALELSKTKLGDKGYYYNASALAIPLANDSVDAILCAHMLYHVDRVNQEVAVNEMIRVTRPGGRILIIYSNPQAPLMLIQRLLKVLRINKLLGKAKLYFHAYPTKWWRKFETNCSVKVLPYDAISTNQAKALLPTVALREKFFKWASWFEDRHFDAASKLWSYIIVILDRIDEPHADAERQSHSTVRAVNVPPSSSL